MPSVTHSTQRLIYSSSTSTPHSYIKIHAYIRTMPLPRNNQVRNASPITNTIMPTRRTPPKPLLRNLIRLHFQPQVRPIPKVKRLDAHQYLRHLIEHALWELDSSSILKLRWFFCPIHAGVSEATDDPVLVRWKSDPSRCTTVQSSVSPCVDVEPERL